MLYKWKNFSHVYLYLLVPSKVTVTSANMMTSIKQIQITLLIKHFLGHQ